MAGGQTFKKKRGRRTNVKREPWQVDKFGERNVTGGQTWREKRDRRVNVER